IVAPIHLLQRRDSPLGHWRGGIWGMNTASRQHTPLESFLLIRAIEEHGLDFAPISNSLQSNFLIKSDPSYDAARLSSETLQELFLNLLWEELKSDNDSPSTRPDGDGLSPASRKRKLHPPRPTLRDARHHVGEMEALYYKLQDSYISNAVKEVQKLESDYDEVQRKISRLEEDDTPVDDVIPGTRPKTPNGGVHDYAVKRDSAHLNGTNATPRPSPKLPAQIAPPIPPPIPASAPSSALPQAPVSIPATASTPTPPVLAPVPATTPGLGHTIPAPSLPHPGPSPRLGQQSLPRPQPARPQDAAKAPNGTPPVLQPPRGIPFQPPPQQFTPPPAAEGLQRPDHISRSRQPTLPLPQGAKQNAQAAPRWEPSYQSNPNSPMQAIPQSQQHQHSQLPVPAPQAHQTTQAPQHSQPQRPTQPIQQPVPPLPRPLQPQTSRPMQQQTLPTAPQNTGYTPYQSSQSQPPQLPSLNQLPQHPQTQQPQLHHIAHVPPQVAHQASHSHLAQIRPAPETQSYAKQPWSPYPHGAQNRINQPPQLPHPSYQNYAPSGVRSPQQLPAPQPHVLQPLQPPSSFPQRGPSSGPPSPAVPPGDTQRGYNSPYQQHARGLVPDRLQHNRPPVAATPGQPSARFAPIPSGPQTPVPSVPLRLITVTGSGTKWSKTSTPSTPKNGGDLRFNEIESPRYEPLSPVLPKAALPTVASRDEIKSEHPGPEPAPQPSEPLPPVETPSVKRKPGRPRGSQKPQDETPSSVAPENPEEGPLNVDVEPTKIKDEVTTPNPAVDAWDTAAEESVGGRRQHKRQTKRKRDDMSPTPGPTPVESQAPAMPDVSQLQANTVWWTRSFHKVSASAMEQIVRHRLANMFAAPIRERDAPGYHKRIIQPQDLKSIKAAIMTGNRLAAQAAAALPGGDPGTSTVALRISEDLIPPKAIINSNQLDRELAHMFANAIMYNQDQGHGPGPAFMVRDDGGEEDDPEGGAGEDSGGGATAAHHAGGEHVLGYKVDEYGVVRDARSMFDNVDAWLSELKAAERQRSAKPSATGTSTRQASVAQGDQPNTATGSGSAAAAADTTMDDADELATEPETAVKRRRTTRNV
ncbi:hypothetical protein V8F33_001944, partial [Rhypophila sp. PSN 637]